MGRESRNAVVVEPTARGVAASVLVLSNALMKLTVARAAYRAKLTVAGASDAVNDGLGSQPEVSDGHENVCLRR